MYITAIKVSKYSGEKCPGVAVHMGKVNKFQCTSPLLTPREVLNHSETLGLQGENRFHFSNSEEKIQLDCNFNKWKKMRTLYATHRINTSQFSFDK